MPFANPERSHVSPSYNEFNIPESGAWEVDSVQEAEIEAQSARLRCFSPV